jgi:hypothetical protein
MAESFLEQIEALDEKLPKQIAGLAVESHAAKDLSVVNGIPGFTGRPVDL